MFSNNQSINFIRYSDSNSNNANNNSNKTILSMLDSNNNFKIFEIIPRIFKITANNESYYFNKDFFFKTSDINSRRLINNQIELNIKDASNVLTKFEQMYQGKLVTFVKSDIPVCNQIVNQLGIHCCPDFQMPGSICDDIKVGLNFKVYK